MENQLLKWYEEIDSDEAPLDSDQDLSDVCSEHSIHNTDSEQSTQDLPSDPEDAMEECSQDDGFERFYGKDKTPWLKHKPHTPKGKTRACNIVTKLPGVKAKAKGAKTILECWKLFFSDAMINNIVKYINQKLDMMRVSYTRPRDCPAVDYEEMLAFIGLLFLAGVKRAQHLNSDELWKLDGTAPDIFAATMAKKRFHQIIQAVRFDDATKRQENSAVDNLAPIREIFEMFVTNCLSTYSPGFYVTIDEMLEAFRGRCKFRQYIANKPAKYGIKIYALVDARTFFTLNLEIYAGKQPEGPYQLPNDAASVVKRLIRPISGTGRNVTTDNYFSSVPLANSLVNDHRLTTIGTLRKNKPQIPPELTNVKGRHLCSSLFAYGDNGNKCLLVSYVPKKKNKNVLLLSTLHSDGLIDENTKETTMKPEIITDYNLTKGGVDVVDKMKAEYSVTRFSNRWPFTVFCSLLNISTINSQIIYKDNTNIVTSRRIYITELGKQLLMPHLQRRSNIPNLPFQLRLRIRNITGEKSSVTQEATPTTKPRCSFCPVRKNRFTQHYCTNCKLPICKEHTGLTNFTCHSCLEEEEN